jgi:hypothetical protein
LEPEDLRVFSDGVRFRGGERATNAMLVERVVRLAAELE